jgi:hypothetical protein
VWKTKRFLQRFVEFAAFFKHILVRFSKIQTSDTNLFLQFHPVKD